MEFIKELSNGEVVNLWSYGTPFDHGTDFSEVAFERATAEFKYYMHAAHAMIFARNDRVLWEKYKVTANIMMQMRFDGNLGFGGGLLDDENEPAVDAVNRELTEEINLDLDKYRFSQTEHIISHVNDKKKLVTHFYAKEVNLKQYEEIERAALDAKEWGVESLGIIRVPLYTVDDGTRGLPLFLANKFAGNARDQLIITMHKLKILPDEQLASAVASYKKYIDLNKQ